MKNQLDEIMSFSSTNQCMMRVYLFFLGSVCCIAVRAQDGCGLQYDVNEDGVVNMSDLLGVLSEFGESCENAGYPCGEPVDFDGYQYATIQIGEQCWFAENLRNVHYANGDSIPGNLTDDEWENTESGAQSVYGEGDSDVWNGSNPDEFENLEKYGRLYNWYAVSDSRGLCPNGWHVPSDYEWIVLEMFLGMSEVEAWDYSTYRGLNEGAKLKSSYLDSPSWNGINTSGFSGLPGGWRSIYGSFSGEGTYGDFWAANLWNEGGAWFHGLDEDEHTIARGVSNQGNGNSVRCIRD